MPKRTEPHDVDLVINAPPARTYVATARAALDAAPTESADGRYDVEIPPWGGWVQLRALSLLELGKMKGQADDEGAFLRAALKASLVTPLFSAGEIDEILDDPRQVEAGALLTIALTRINKLGELDKRVAVDSFRPPVAD